ncbi:papC N-terminal domain protein [Escherichia coli 5-172-05_S1_C3]|nr:papC N-terminal domain protein [Escherichia coli 5-172-05_S1_C3]
MPDHSLFRLRILPWCIALAMSGSYSSVWAEDDIQFDSRFLELKGDTKIDLKRFSSQGYVEPGKYNLQVQLNKQPLAEEYDIYWYAGEDDVREGANKRGNSSRLTQSFHFFMFEPIFSPVNALNQPI